jgi:ATP-dependent DNA helicase RecG
LHIQLKGKIRNVKQIGEGRGARLTADFIDNTGSLQLVWFKGIRWLKTMFNPETTYIVYGKPKYFKGSYSIIHPEVDAEEEINKIEGSKLHPVYHSTEKCKSKNLDTRNIQKLLRNLIPQVIDIIVENIPVEILHKYKLMARNIAFGEIHFPSSTIALDQAIRRLKFEELFLIQLELIGKKLVRRKTIKGFVFSQIGKYFNTFFHQNLPFKLTQAQKKVIKEIRNDLGKGIQMNRLLQGDVGSGKTLVALMSMLIAIDNGYQTAIMAPTEILATQHFNSIRKFLEGMEIHIALLTGSTKKKDRKQIDEDLQSGKLNILIGTHALLEDTVVFRNLGFVVIDEQHRFGVAQRAKFWKKNQNPPHILVMTATPIPRTLAMTLYGDLDVSVIDELPPGRKPIQTIHLYEKDRLRLFGFLKRKIQEGEQIYIVYPLIEESEKLDLKNLIEGYEAITRYFPIPDYQISILHGKMESKTKEFEMQRFAKGETQIMISTTVIEVGVDVPNASVMVIENAERFGLSQLHQLRGRVGRGANQSHCILMSDYKLSKEAKIRLQTMVDSNDGFRIAEVDLKLRGPGDMKGTQQSGVMEFKIANIIKDEKILKYAREEALQLLEADPNLLKKENQALRNYLIENKKNKFDWSVIS